MSEAVQRIDVKAAVNAAYQYLSSLQDVLGNPIQNLALEEVELSPNENSWLITLGYDRPLKDYRTEAQTVASLFGSPSNIQRVYKLFRVNSRTGDVEAMKIREV